MIETAHLTAAEITELTERAAEDLGMRKSSVAPGA